MTKPLFESRFAVATLGCLLAASAACVCAQTETQTMGPDNPPGGLRYLEAGQPPVLVHPTVDASRQHQFATAAAAASASNNLYYHGGVGGIGVETAPKIYLVLWGSQWNNNDPSGEEAILVNFYRGVGGNAWTNSVTQYCQGVASGTYTCGSSGQHAGNQSGMFVAAWYDNAAAAPTHPTQSQMATEAARAAAFFGNKTAASNASVQYVIATSHSHNMRGFATQWCAWHSSTSSSYGTIAYTNMPYMTDGGASCGANFNGLGAKAGITIVGGHEMAETMTDQFPNGGWLDSSGAENGDKCAWISSGQGASADVTFSTGTFPVQSLWSNAFSGGSGGCVLSY